MAAAQEDRDSKLSGDSGRSIHRQGESLLPYLEQLRTTLKLDPPQISSSGSEEAICVPPLEDSGTESGEDLRLLAGLRDSICDRQALQKDDNENDVLTEIHNTLKTLQTTFDSRLATEKTLDPETKNNLLELVVRLQESLKMTPEKPKPMEDVTPAGSRSRFQNRRNLRQNRHTVGVTTKELADARMWLEKNGFEKKGSQNFASASDNAVTSGNGNVQWIQQKEIDSHVNSTLFYPLVKGNSVGDLTNNQTHKPFRPVNFNPAKYQTNSVGNAKAKPYSFFKDSSNVENSGMQTPKHPGTLFKNNNDSSEKKETENVATPGQENTLSGGQANGSSILSNSCIENKNKNFLNSSDDKDRLKKSEKPTSNAFLKAFQNSFHPGLKERSDILNLSKNKSDSNQNDHRRSNAINNNFPRDSDGDLAAEYKMVYSDTFGERDSANKFPAYKRSMSENQPAMDLYSGSSMYAPNQPAKEILNKPAPEVESQKSQLSIDSDLSSSDEHNDEEDTYSESDNENLAAKRGNVLQSNTNPSKPEITRAQAPVNGYGGKKSVSEQKRSELNNSYYCGLANYQKEPNQKINNFEKRLQEIQNEKNLHSRSKGRSIEEMQKTYKERKERESENRRSKMIQNAQAKYEETWAKQAPNFKTYNHHLQSLNGESSRKYLSDQKKTANGVNAKSKQAPTFNDIECDYGGDIKRTESEISISSTSTSESSVCHAQKLLLIATNDQPGKNYNKAGKRLKMKRSNTIDIPKPLNFYEVENDSDYSDEEQRPARQYTPLSGHFSYAFKPNASVPPQLKPKTESDRRFVAFLAKQSQPVVSNAIWKKEHTPGIHSVQQTPFSADQWENRFSRIKTAFENPARGASGEVKCKFGSSVVKNVKGFGKSADDSAAVLKPRGEFYATANGPRLTRQGSKFLKKLFEQKEAEDKSVKLPWANASNEHIVVGSLTVGTQKPAKEFLPSVDQLPKPSVTVNQFRHAPMSAFKPVQKKPAPVSENVKPNFDSSPLTSKFNHPPKQIFETIEDNKNPILPWIKQNGAPQCDKSVSSALNKFENLFGSKPQINHPQHINVYSDSVIKPLLYKSSSQPSLIHNKIEYTPSCHSSVMSSPRIQPVYRMPSEPINYAAPSVKEKAKHFQTSFANPVSVKCPKLFPEPKKENFKPITTYSVDVAATATVYAKNDDSPVENNYFPLSDPDTNASTPEEHVAVTKIMGSSNQQQAVTVKHKSHWKEDEANDSKSSAIKSLTSTLQKFSSPNESKKDLQTYAKLSPTRSSLPGATPPRSPLLPPKLPTGKISPGSLSSENKSPVSSVSYRREDNPVPNSNHFQVSSPVEAFKQLSVERSLPRAASGRTSADSEEFRENENTIVTSRLQIPYRVPSAQSIATPSPRDLSPSERLSRSPDAFAYQNYLQKSESCHQLSGLSKPKRPQSLIMPNLPTPQRRPVNPLLKTKSSHALGFGGKQFEASINQEMRESKQKTVEEYFSMKNSSSKTKQSQKKQIALPGQELVKLDDNLENVDEAFDALFNSVTSDSSGKKGRMNENKFTRTNSNQLSKSVSASALNCK